ncbi:hypothetical protein [Cloacibacterium sp. TD35]|uniref:hypothetical protein n=1 Tax=Cloacibacterium sp. TD35 TaxID=2976818 RepID=UPI00237D7EE6|nr:hypothetical protein [Cloacibacterium sp. TD35]WDT68698.1 hypothetical protein N7277_03590 [Cloacibacterium sp. TD35]
MRKLFTLFTLVLIQFIFSQENTFTNQTQKISLSENGNFFIYNNQTYGLKHYNIIFKNEEAKSILTSARANKSIGNVLGFTGGFLMGFGFIMGISGSNDPNIDQDSYKNAGWSVFGIGAGVTLLSLPFSLSVKSKLKKAVEIENGEKTAFNPYFKFQSTGNGIALSYHF